MSSPGALGSLKNGTHCAGVAVNRQSKSFGSDELHDRVVDCGVKLTAATIEGWFAATRIRTRQVLNAY